MLTGKTRYRTTWRGKVVLQVEEAAGYCHDLNGSGYYDTGTYKFWRDATLADITTEPAPIAKPVTYIDSLGGI